MAGMGWRDACRDEVTARAVKQFLRSIETKAEACRLYCAVIIL
jgi:hypothetical protein